MLEVLMEYPLLVGFALLMLMAGLALWASSALQARTGLSSSAEILASDTGQERVELIRDPETGLVGQPDFLIEERVGLFRRKKIVPVEVKPSRESDQLYDSDQMQAVVYMLLVQAKYGNRFAGYSYVRYKERTFRVELTDLLRRKCLMYANGVREARQSQNVHRSHEQAGRCRGCSVRDACGEALV